MGEEKAIPKVPPPDYIARAKGRTVRVALLDGSDFTGIIDGYNRYEIRLKIDDKHDLLIFKHAIKMIKGDFSRKGNSSTEEATK